MTTIDPKSIPVRFSNLKAMAQSPAHYLAALSSSYDSPAMRLGRLVHAMVLTPERELAIYDGTRRGKSWDEYATAHRGEEIYTRSEADAAIPIARAVLSDPHAARLLQTGLRERRIEWTRAGRKCAGTPDFFNADVLVDLKSCASADPRRWTGRFGEIRKRAYHAQVSWYLDGLEAAGYPRPRDAYLIAVETRAPFPVVVYRVAPSELDHGGRLVTTWFEELRVCEESNSWPGYAQTVIDVEAIEDDEMPALTFGDDEEQEEAA